MKIEILPAYNRTDDIRALFTEYTDLLSEGDAQFRDYLQIQHYDDEFAHPEQKYGFPGGRLYIALCNGETAGCVALHRLSDTACEIKRLYVRDAYRGNGIGKTMVEEVRILAKAFGCSQLILGVHAENDYAVGFYQKCGFRIRTINMDMQV